MAKNSWELLADEAVALREAPLLRAYSERMPPPWVGLKPAEPSRLLCPPAGESEWLISEYEEANELRPGLERLSAHVLGELRKLIAGRSHELPRRLVEGNPCWPPELARHYAERERSLTLILPLALSRTQDDKGNVPWTLFGVSHLGADFALWRELADLDVLSALLRFSCGIDTVGLESIQRAAVRVLPRNDARLPPSIAPLRWHPGDDARVLITSVPFARLAPELQQAFLEARLELLPSPPTLIFFEHAGYERLAESWPWARQISLLQLFPRSERRGGLRIPQSGWLDEHTTGNAMVDGHRVVSGVARRHRWQRTERQIEDDGEFLDRVSDALFSTNPDHLGLYGKPMACSAQIWTRDYQPLLDGPRAGREEIARAAETVLRGGRFGYRFCFPPMQVGARVAFLHRLAAAREQGGRFEAFAEASAGTLVAERAEAEPVVMPARVMRRSGHLQASRLVARERGRPNNTSAMNARKLLEWRELLGQPLPRRFARRLLHVRRRDDVDAWLATLPAHAPDEATAAVLRAHLERHCLGSEEPPPLEPLTFEATATRTFEERLWRQIAELAEGRYVHKDNADLIRVNAGRSGGAQKQRLRHAEAGSDLEALGDHLLRLHRETIARHGMTGSAHAGSHRFRWETDFDFGWSEGWRRAQHAETERNLVVVIPGRDRSRAVVMADHYDTAYMEDVYEPERGGDRFRAAAAGADDNHSATSALLLAAEVLLPLSKQGKLAQDVWLVHLTGEEFPSDCLGARMLARGLLRQSLTIDTEDARIELGSTRVTGVFVLDMVAHNNSRARDVFQIAPGEGVGSAQLAWRAHRAAEAWNAEAKRRNLLERKGLGRAVRCETGAQLPPPFAHLALAGEIRPEWDPRSALYNTDGQIFSDVGIPVVLFMENYDINRHGYHDTEDTMANIDLDYASALVAIAVETVAQTASAG